MSDVLRTGRWLPKSLLPAMNTAQGTGTAQICRVAGRPTSCDVSWVAAQRRAVPQLARTYRHCEYAAHG